MLGVLCARHRPWLLTSLSLSYAHGSAAAPFDRLLRSPLHTVGGVDGRDYSIHRPARCSGAATVWHTILPSYWRRRQATVFIRHDYEAVKRGEGSWNVAWDARPARWLHHPDSEWLLFGVCAAAPLIDPDPDSNSEVLLSSDESETRNYKVTGVAADGRCLFRAVAHIASLRNGEKVPDENSQRQLADELRAQVVKELLKRRTEIEWFIDEDFDRYVKRIEHPNAWGGEPELRMCTHVLRAQISVFMKDESSTSLIKIADYGEEYRRDEENSINVLFYKYGHYDILEPASH